MLTRRVGFYLLRDQGMKSYKKQYLNWDFEGEEELSSKQAFWEGAKLSHFPCSRRVHGMCET